MRTKTRAQENEDIYKEVPVTGETENKNEEASGVNDEVCITFKNDEVCITLVHLIVDKL